MLHYIRKGELWVYPRVKTHTPGNRRVCLRSLKTFLGEGKKEPDSRLSQTLSRRESNDDKRAEKGQRLLKEEGNILDK
jgi:hypothetical protein